MRHKPRGPRPPPPPLSEFATAEEIAAAQELNERKAANKAARLAALRPYMFQRGKTKGNGRLKGSRNRLQNSFVLALADDFDKFGRKAIERAREDDPMGYIRVIACLMPKQVEQTTPLEELSDDELAAGIDYLRSRLSVGHGQGVGEEAQPKQVIELRPVPETA